MRRVLRCSLVSVAVALALACPAAALRVAYGGQFGSNTRTNAVAPKLSIPF